LKAIAPHAEAAFVTSCDVPLLAPDFVRKMIAALADAEVAVPIDEEGGRTFHHPLAAVYRTCVLPAVEQLLAEDRLRLVSLFDAVATRRVSVGALDRDSGTLLNVNTPADYAAALSQAKAGDIARTNAD
jgi:molybdopterin-guanine dinucleotide biosynthesis protein A